MLVTCARCANFIKPAQQYEYYSLGLCLVLERHLDNYPQRRPSPEEYSKLYAELGGKVWWPNAERNCKKFIE